jgi:hypothetical protein
MKVWAKRTSIKTEKLFGLSILVSVAKLGFYFVAIATD